MTKILKNMRKRFKEMSIGTWIFTANKINAALLQEQKNFEPDLYSSALRIIFSTVLVVGLIFLTLFFLRNLLKNKWLTKDKGGNINILDKYYIAPKKAICLVKIFDRILILGDSEKGITLLGELKEEERAQIMMGALQKKQGFSAILGRISNSKKNDMKKTVSSAMTME